MLMPDYTSTPKLMPPSMTTPYVQPLMPPSMTTPYFQPLMSPSMTTPPYFEPEQQPITAPPTPKVNGAMILVVLAVALFALRG